MHSVKLRSRRSQLQQLSIVHLACNVDYQLQVPLQVSTPCRQLAKHITGILYIDIGTRPVGMIHRHSRKRKVPRSGRTPLQLDLKICPRNVLQALRPAMPPLVERSLPASHKRNAHCSASSDIATSLNALPPSRSLSRPRLPPLP